MVDSGYKSVVYKIKAEIESARMSAVISVNQNLLILYWKIGRVILEQQEANGWGSKIIERLSADLRRDFPGMKGISVRNLKYMRAFAEAYPMFLSSGADSAIVQVSLAQLTWYHHITLLDKVKNIVERNFYIQKAIENSWSRNVLVHQLESGLFYRQGKSTNNFAETLHPSQSDLAREMLKDPYKFDFLELSEEHFEKDLEDALVGHMTKFLLELGAGFSYVGRQYHLEVGGTDFYLDLLFYHLKLRCYVVIELKTGKFAPEYISKLNFYLNVVDDALRHPSDNETIGILICKESNKIVAEYSLRGVNKPIGVAEYDLSRSVPENLKGSLPTIEEIEKELENN